MGRASRSASPDEFPLLKNIGLKTTAILGDGNCLFRALADQIFGDENRHAEIRETVVDFMRENGSDFVAFVSIDTGGGFRRNLKRKNVRAAPIDNSPIAQEEIDANFENYLNRMACNGTYGDNLEIRAFSRAYDTDVKVYSRAHTFLTRASEDGVLRGVAHIALHTYEHYSSVRNIGGPDWGLPNIINNDIVDIPSSAPTTPTSSFSSSGSSSMERDFDSEDEYAVDGPRKKSRSPQSTEPAVDNADVPILSLDAALTAAPEKKVVTKIILTIKPQPNGGYQLKPRRRLVPAREYKALKKLEQKKKSKERKKLEAAVAHQVAVPSNTTMPSMRTLAI